MNPVIVKEGFKYLAGMLTGAIIGGTPIYLEMGTTKFQLGQCVQTVEVLAPENPVVKYRK